MKPPSPLAAGYGICNSSLTGRKEQHDSIVRGHKETEDLIQRFFPGAIAALPAIRDCIQVRMSDSHITAFT